MGSWFSSVAGAEYVDYTRTIAVPKDAVARLQRLMDEAHAVPNPRTQEELDACFICKLADQALQHYNFNHKCPHLPITKMKADCVVFRKDLWYHLNFSARRRDDHDEEQSFFAELRYDQCSDDLIVHICTILEKRVCRFRSSCAFCPDESKIFHPSNAEIGCGKEGHEMEIFRERRRINGHTNEFFSKSDMLSIPFLQGGRLPRYRHSLQ
ncbi:hypothetical protein VPH35_041394 [Triticum aestivum]